MTALKEELETFNQRRRELLGHSTGKYVLIRGSEIVATYDTERDAINEGYRRFGNVPFLVKRVASTDERANYLSGNVGV
jgi:hypothetical protein